MADLPASLVKRLTLDERRLVYQWWTGLSKSARVELGALYSPNAESCAFALQRDEGMRSSWEPLPVTVDSRLLVESSEPDADWDGDFFEYRLVHPDQFRLPEYEYRIFYIGGTMLPPSHFTQFARILSAPSRRILSNSFRSLVLG